MKRICYGCKSSKNIDLFKRNSSKPRGRDYLCIECHKKYCRTRRIKNSIKISEYNRQYRISHRERLNKQWNDWKTKNKEKVSAHAKARYALMHEKIKKLPCSICGEVESEMHHPNYSMPLEIIWLCRKHHSETRKSFN